MKYPIGIQNFRELRHGGYVYVDKTAYIHRIVTQGKYFFLSRPRRFGKSLLLSTMREMYTGNRELFEGLWVEPHWNWEQQNPIVWLRFSQIDYQEKGLHQALVEETGKLAGELGIALQTETLKDRFQELIVRAGAERKTVLLIDEYDKPIIDYLEEPETAEANRQVLKNLYSVLKDNDPYLELVFITGVSAFSKVSIFSDLNNLFNLTLAKQADRLLGITQLELQHYFEAPLRKIAEKSNLTYEAIIEKVRTWYNGYSWTGQEKVYNPFSLLGFLAGGQFRNFWFETGTPTFLVRALRKQQYYNLDHQPAVACTRKQRDRGGVNDQKTCFRKASAVKTGMEACLKSFRFRVMKYWDSFSTAT